MSVLTSTCVEINKNPSNNSQSKQLWTFPRKPRFEENSSYTSNIPFLNDNRSKNKYSGASIGYGERSNYWLRHNKYKSDRMILPPSDFIKDKRVNNSGSPSYSFGRKPKNPLKLYDENIKFNYKPEQPGPCDYNPSKLKPGEKYSMKGRHFYDKRLKNYPGPGHYKSGLEMNSLGKYAPSNKPNTQGAIFSDLKDNRFSSVVKSKILYIINRRRNSWSW